MISLVMLSNINYVSAEELNLKITGTVNNLSSDVYLKTNENAINATDSYDMLVKELPSGNYSIFYSNVSSNQLSIDSWEGEARITSLVYETSTAQTGALTFSWAPITGSFDGTFMDYGDDSTYTTVVSSANMRTSSSYTTNLNGESNFDSKNGLVIQ